MTCTTQQSIAKLLLLCALFLGMTQAAGNFSQTCNSLRYSNGALFASCRKRNGSYSLTVINLNAIISNRNGSLVWDAINGKYLNTCRNNRFGGTTLGASCAKPNGTYLLTSIDLNERIANIDGRLYYS